MNVVKGIFGGGDDKQNPDKEKMAPGGVGPNAPDRADAAVAVAMPVAGTAKATQEYTTADIQSGEKKLPVGQVREGVEAGKDYEMRTTTQKVPVTEMKTETVEVPTTEMQTVDVTKPVTKTKDVTETVREVEMKKELVDREEVVLEKETVAQPTTVMKPVKSEVPRIDERKVRVPQLHEELKTIHVVRPKEVKKTVKVQRPVEVQRTITGKRPVRRTKMVKTRAPERVVKKVNITQPVITDYSAEVQVAEDVQKHVEYEKPVTVIRSTEAESVSRDANAKATTKSDDKEGVARDAKHDDDAIAKAMDDRDWSEIPVGIPFTEMVKKNRNFTEKRLKTVTESVRHTDMQPQQYDKVDYEMRDVEMEVVFYELEDYEETVTVTEMQDVEEEVEVTVMEKVKEEWPVAKERTAEVWTSEVSLEPIITEVPEIGTTNVTVEKPKTITKTEEIQKPVTHEREVTTQKAYTEDVTVQEERAVETTKQVEVQKPVTRYEEREVEKATTVDKKVDVSGVSEQQKKFTDESATQRTATKDYTVAQATTKAMAVPMDVEIEGDVGTTVVSNKEKEAAKNRDAGVKEPGVERKAVIKDGFADESAGMAGTAAKDPRALVPGAMLDDARVQGKGDANMEFGGDLMGRSEAERMAEKLGKGTDGYAQTGRTVEEAAAARAKAEEERLKQQREAESHKVEVTATEQVTAAGATEEEAKAKAKAKLDKDMASTKFSK